MLKEKIFSLNSSRLNQDNHGRPTVKNLSNISLDDVLYEIYQYECDMFDFIDEDNKTFILPKGWNGESPMNDGYGIVEWTLFEHENNRLVETDLDYFSEEVYNYLIKNT